MPIAPNQPAETAATPVRSRVRPLEVIWVALFVGALAGVAELSLHLVKMIALNRFVWLSRDLLWMTPLAATVFVLLPAIPLALLAAAWSRLTTGWVVGVLVFTGALGLLLNVPRIAPYALAIAALGIAVRLAAFAKARPEAWYRVARRGSLILGAVTLLMGAGERVFRWRGERTALARLGSASDTPNVLLIIFDTVRHANMSLYGYKRPTTPHLAKLASSSAVFDYALSTAPWTLPSHASFFTGRYPDATAGDWLRPVRSSRLTLAEALSARGYVTGGFVNNLLYTSYESGLNRGFARYVDYPITFPLIVRHFSLGRTVVATRLLDSRSLHDVRTAVTSLNLHRAREGADEPANAERLSNEFLEWERERAGRPFFAFINYFEAHGLFQPTAQEERRFPGGKRIDYYDAAIFRLDGEVSRVLDSLQRRGVLDNTIVIVTSDHGEHMGEHGLEGHANSLYLPVLRVPLVMHFPKAIPARRVAEPVTLRDLPATILELAGVREKTGIPGTPLSRFWRDSADTGTSPLYASLDQGINVVASARNARGSLAAIFDEKYHLIHGPGDREELYAYRSDSLEEENLTEELATDSEVQSLRDVLGDLSGARTARNGRLARAALQLPRP